MNDNDYKKLLAEAKNYLDLELKYQKLTITEKIAVLLSAIALVAVMIILGSFAFFFLSSSIVAWLTELTGSAWSASLIYAAVLIVIMLFVIALKKPLIYNPITRFISKLLLNPNDDNDRQ